MVGGTATQPSRKLTLRELWPHIILIEWPEIIQNVIWKNILIFLLILAKIIIPENLDFQAMKTGEPD